MCRLPQREQVIAEVLRVARKVAVFGYPCGPAAFEIDQKLYRDYQNRRSPAPAWLEEHMLHPFPDEQLWAALPGGWKSKSHSQRELAISLLDDADGDLPACVTTPFACYCESCRD